MSPRTLPPHLFDLEQVIMDVVWSRNLVGFSVGDIVTALEKKRPMAYTTAMTTVARLYDKGLLSREKDGKRYVYAAKLTREGYLEITARQVLSSTIGTTQAIALLSEKVAKASEKELQSLEAIIARRRKEMSDEK